MYDKPEGHEVVEARLHLIIAMMQEEIPIWPEIAEESRRLFETRIGGGPNVPLSTLLLGEPNIEEWGEERQLAFRRLQGGVRILHHLWDKTEDNPYFELDLCHRMAKFFVLVARATKAVQLRALEALQDPKNWPFDPDLSPEHETNVEAAKAHGVTYKPDLRQYVDEDGCPRYDHFGQPL